MVSPESPINPLSPENTNKLHEVDTLPARLGLEEPPELGTIRTALIDAVSSGDTETIRLVGQQFHDVLDPITNIFDNEDGRLAVIILQAAIWREGGDIEKYIGYLIDAHTLSDNLGNEPMATILAAEIKSFFGTAEYNKAQADRQD